MNANIGDTAIISSPDLIKKPRGKAPKRSRIWEIFSVQEHDQCKAICNECQTVVSRGGGTARSQCTTNLWNHVKNKHPQIFEEIKKFKEDMHRYQDNRINKRALATRALETERYDEFKIWDLFSVSAHDKTIAKCNECNLVIVKRKEDNESDALWYHMISYHPHLYSKCVNESIDDVFSGSKSRRSTVWNEFTQHPLDSCKVVCNTCDTVVSRGTAKEKLNTTNMRRHLKGSNHLNALQSKGLSQDSSAHLEDDIKSDRESNFHSPSVDLQRALSEAMAKCANSLVPPYQKMNISHIDDHPNENSAGSSDYETFPKMGDIGDMMKNRQVDMVHTALIMNSLYQQQQLGICCDFSIYVTNNSIHSSQKSTTGSTSEFKLHKCVAGTISDKLRTTIQSGSDRLTIPGVDEDATRSFIEIVYTGKLNKIGTLTKEQLQDIYNVAKMLSTDTVIDYLERSYPNFDIGESPKPSPPIFMNGTVNPCKNPNESRTSGSPNNSNSSKHISTIPKVNKRKNYLPVANESSRKRHKTTEKEYDRSDASPSQIAHDMNDISSSFTVKTYDSSSASNETKEHLRLEMENNQVNPSHSLDDIAKTDSTIPDPQYINEIIKYDLAQTNNNSDNESSEEPHQPFVS